MEQVKLFLDTNIVIDYFSGRMADSMAERIVLCGQTPYYELCISPLTGVNTIYVARKLGKTISPDLLSSMFTILPMDAKQWKESSLYAVSDPEDALQLSCAVSNSCHIFITRDSELLALPSRAIKVISPADFVSGVSL